MKKGHVLGVLTILLLAVVVVAGPGSWKYSASDLYGSNCIQEIIDAMSAGTYTNGLVSATSVTASATVTGADVTATDDVTVGDDCTISGLATIDETLIVGGAVTASNGVDISGGVLTLANDETIDNNTRNGEILFNGIIGPAGDGTIDLGSSTNEFKDIYIDGTANLDAADITTLTIGGSATYSGIYTNPGIGITNVIYVSNGAITNVIVNP